jgi:hypothetical protein
MVTKFEPIERSNRFHNRTLRLELICRGLIYICWSCAEIYVEICKGS